MISPLTIGWRERVDLPDWHLRGVKAKIDTGANTSAIDVAQIEDLPNGDIRFEVVYRIKPERRTKWVTATPVRTSTVKPSHGEAQERPVCRTRIKLGEHDFEIDISLVCRQGMLCRMLLGRRALAGHFLVDSSNKYLIPRTPRSSKKAPNP